VADASRSLPLGPLAFYAPPLGVSDVVASFSGSLPLGALAEIGGANVGNTLVATAGTYAYTGVSATLKMGFRATAEVGSYAYDGVDATLTRAGPTNVFGPPAPLPVFADLFTGTAGVYRLTTYVGNYAYSGSTANLSSGFTLTAQTGNYPYVGADGQRDLALSIGTGAFAYTGVSATITKGRVLTATAGSYAYAGNVAGLFYENLTGNYTLACLGGDYAYTGMSANLYKSNVLQATVGAYAYTGRNATLRKVGLYDDPWNRVPTSSDIWTPVNPGDATWETIE
jgi:hypothetical protein